MCWRLASSTFPPYLQSLYGIHSRKKIQSPRREISLLTVTLLFRYACTGEAKLSRRSRHHLSAELLPAHSYADIKLRFVACTPNLFRLTLPIPNGEEEKKNGGSPDYLSNHPRIDFRKINSWKRLTRRPRLMGGSNDA